MVTRRCKVVSHYSNWFYYFQNWQNGSVVVLLWPFRNCQAKGTILSFCFDCKTKIYFSDLVGGQPVINSATTSQFFILVCFSVFLFVLLYQAFCVAAFVHLKFDTFYKLGSFKQRFPDCFLRIRGTQHQSIKIIKRQSTWKNVPR